jgi:hypothetical protein
VVLADLDVAAVSVSDNRFGVQTTILVAIILLSWSLNLLAPTAKIGT